MAKVDFPVTSVPFPPSVSKSFTTRDTQGLYSIISTKYISKKIEGLRNPLTFSEGHPIHWRAMPSWTSRATQNDEMLAVARVWLRDRVLPRVLMLVACARGRPAPLPAETAD